MTRARHAVGSSLAIAAALLTSTALATPPEYTSIDRQQRVDLPIDERDLLRIWCLYVGQGDGILIQLPRRFSYRLDDADGDTREERIDVLVDGGSFEERFTGEVTDFLKRLYPNGGSIEHVVLSHHDKDHVTGLTKLLKTSNIGVDYVYHNGLASYGAGARGLPKTGRPKYKAVFDYDKANDRIRRALGAVREADGTFLPRFVMQDLADLRRSLERKELQGSYQDFADAIVKRVTPRPVQGFLRAAANRPFINGVEKQKRSGIAPIEFQILWPGESPVQYRGWDYTINGNSITFRLVYRDFEMLFTGDHNEVSQRALLDQLGDSAEEALHADVLKVPHHGSKEALREFFDAVSPALSVASQGPRGARSKKVAGDLAWEHPSPEIVSWLGGAHRVYLTQLQERRFEWSEVTSQSKLRDMEELYYHVLIETDGKWFRVVEVPRDWSEFDEPPSVRATARSDGTRWIRANSP